MFCDVKILGIPLLKYQFEKISLEKTKHQVSGSQRLFCSQMVSSSIFLYCDVCSNFVLFLADLEAIVS